MNLEERAKQFVDGYDASFIGPMRLERIAKCAADFASEAVKARDAEIIARIEQSLSGGDRVPTGGDNQMSELTDLLAKWVQDEAPRNKDGDLIADRFDFFRAGYDLANEKSAEAVKAEREKIADELEAIIDKSAGSTNEAEDVLAYIARLRGERE